MNEFEYLNSEKARPSGMRDAWIEVNLSAVEQNVRSIKSLLKQRTELMAVVKADGYGHGAEQVAFAASVAGATRFGVATADEALELKRAGIVMPIHVLSEVPQTSFEPLLEAGIVFAAASKSFLQNLSQTASSRGIDAVVHLKVNTGMNRIGIKPLEAVEVFELAAALPHIKIEGVFTHFASADIEGDWEVERQLRTFCSVVDRLKEAGFDPGVVHAANTAATILLPESHFDMVRVGIGLYGLHPSKDTHGHISLEPAMSVIARTTGVNPISIGDGVSYGLTWRAFQKAEIATLPLGYADGIPRLASNQIFALVRGRRVPCVGRICMDQMMCEIAAPFKIEKGEEFVLIGRQGDEEILMDEIAQAAQTINYEVACALTSRLERVYVR